MPIPGGEDEIRANWKRKRSGRTWRQLDSSSDLYSEGDVVNLKRLLFHKNRDFLIKNNKDLVTAWHLIGKVVVLYFVSVRRRSVWIDKNTNYLVDIYTKLASLSCPFEVVLVAIKDEHDDPMISEKNFQDLFSIMPWTAIPFADSEARRRLEKSFLGSKYRTYSTIAFVISETGEVFLENALKRMGLFGAEGYPFSKQRLQRLRYEDDEARASPSLKNLLVSPECDYVINNKGDKVSICDLEDKVVALLLYEERRTSELTDALRDAYKHWVEEKKMKFEVVLIYITDSYHTFNCTNAESFQKVFKTMPWLAIPFNGGNCKKVLRVVNYPFELGVGPGPDPSLVIIGPHGEFVEPWGSTILMNFGIDAYPWTYDKVCTSQFEKVKQFNLNMLWGPETVFVRQCGSSEVLFSKINVGKRIVVFCDYTASSELYDEFRMKLQKKYLESMGRDDEFEVIYLDLYYHNEESFQWLSLQRGQDYDRNVSAVRAVFKDLLHKGFGILVFDVDGKIVRATSYPTFEGEDSDFPFYTGCVEDEVVEHINQLYKLDYEIEPLNL